MDSCPQTSFQAPTIERRYSSIVYRAHSISEVFVRRRGELVAELFATYHDPDDGTQPRLWPLTNECEITEVSAATFSVAEDGWKPITAWLMSKTYRLEGYIISLTWPRSRMMADTMLVLGFDSEDGAAEWRTALTNSIMGGQSLTVNEQYMDTGAQSMMRGPFSQADPAGSSEVTMSNSQEPSNEHSYVQESESEKVEVDQTRLNQSWTAIKELDGLVVYYQEDATGGAYMVSSLIHSNPKAVCHALTTGSFLLCCGEVSLVRREGNVEILHLQLPPVGLGNLLLSPRLLLIERMLTEYPSGTVGVFFKSCEQECTPACHDKQQWWSWFTNPVEAYIPAAGFTMSPVESSNGQPTDTLLTLVLKIDLGGACSVKHPLKPVVDGLGLCQSWIDRILQTVTLLKNRMESEPQLHATPSLRSVMSRKLSSASFRQNSFPSEAPGRFDEMDNNHALSNGVLNTRFWRSPGNAGFRVRGPSYLTDKEKIPAEEPHFALDWVYILKLDRPTPNIARHLPALRTGMNDFTFVLQVMIPGPPYLAMVIGWTSEDISIASLQNPESRGPFKNSFLRFLRSDAEERDGMFKLIPKVVEGTWIIRRAVGSTPVIMGRKLKQSYHSGNGYFEIDIDVASSRTASAVISLVQGATRSLTVDLAVLIQGDYDDELPESLIGTVRLDHVDMDTAVTLDALAVEE